MTKKLPKNTAEKVVKSFVDHKIAIYLSLCLHKWLPGYKRSLQPSKENIQQLQKMKFIFFFFIFVGHFCPSWSGSWLRIRIGSRYLIKSGSGSTTLTAVIVYSVVHLPLKWTKKKDVLYFSSILFECQKLRFFSGTLHSSHETVAPTLSRTNQSLCKSSLLFRRSSSFFQERPTRTFVSPRTFSSSKNSCKSRRGALSPNQHRWTAANGGCSVAGSRKRSLPAGADMDSRFTARAATRDIVIFWRPIFFPFWKKNGGYTVEGLLRFISDTRLYRIQCTKYHRSPKVLWSTPKNLWPKRPCPWTSKSRFVDPEPFWMVSAPEDTFRIPFQPGVRFYRW